MCPVVKVPSVEHHLVDGARSSLCRGYIIHSPIGKPSTAITSMAASPVPVPFLEENST